MPATTPQMSANVPPPSHWSRIGKLILGSTSWSRRTLLTALNLTFTTLAPDIDERAIERPEARQLVLAIAHAKATALQQRHQIALADSGRTLLVCGDSVVTHRGRILGKPKDVDEAMQFIHGYASAPATTVSSVVVVDVATGLRWFGVDEAEVYFRPMPSSVVEDVARNGGALQSAGGLRIEHPLVEKYTECIIGHYSAVMGFSQPLVTDLLQRAMDGVDGVVYEG